MRWTTLVRVSAALPVAETSAPSCCGVQGEALSGLAIVTTGFKQDRRPFATCKLVDLYAFGYINVRTVHTLTRANTRKQAGIPSPLAANRICGWRVVC